MPYITVMVYKGVIEAVEVFDTYSEAAGYLIRQLKLLIPERWNELEEISKSIKSGSANRYSDLMSLSEEAEIQSLICWRRFH